MNAVPQLISFVNIPIEMSRRDQSGSYTILLPSNLRKCVVCSAEQKKHLDIAWNLLKKQRDWNISSQNFEARTGRKITDDESITNLKIGRELIYHSLTRDILNLFSQAILEAKCGNCGDITLVALDYALKEFPEVSFETGTLENGANKNGNHQFLVIGRPTDSNFEDYKTWGQATVICDLWSRTIYFAKDIQLYMRNYIQSIQFQKPIGHLIQAHTYYPKVEPVDGLIPAAYNLERAARLTGRRHQKKHPCLFKMDSSGDSKQPS